MIKNHIHLVYFPLTNNYEYINVFRLRSISMIHIVNKCILY